jgi:hypothetical protein
MTEHEVIEKLSELSGYEWKALSSKMARFYRKNPKHPTDLPSFMEGYEEFVVPESEWRRIRQKVNARRRNVRDAIQSERRNRQKLNRKLYMREYMAMYRRRLK